MKVLIVLAEVGIIEVIWLQSKGILAVDYDKLNAFAQNTTQTIMNAAATGNNHAVGNAGIIHYIASFMSVPMLGGAALFKKLYVSFSFSDNFASIFLLVVDFHHHEVMKLLILKLS